MRKEIEVAMLIYFPSAFKSDFAAFKISYVLVLLILLPAK
jgi:hypothetical protein